MTTEELAVNELVDVIVGGARHYWLRDRGDAMVKAIDLLAEQGQNVEGGQRPSPDRRALLSLVESTVEAMRAQLNPFAGFMEAPKAVIDLYQKHGEVARQAEVDRDTLLEPILREVVVALFRASGPLKWPDLIDQGVPREAPRPPDDDDW